MTTQIKSQDLGFPLYMTACACIAALSGLNIGWHISKFSNRKFLDPVLILRFSHRCSQHATKGHYGSSPS